MQRSGWSIYPENWPELSLYLLLSLSHSQPVFRSELACRRRQRAQGELRRIDISVVLSSSTICHTEHEYFIFQKGYRTQIGTKFLPAALPLVRVILERRKQDNMLARGGSSIDRLLDQLTAEGVGTWKGMGIGEAVDWEGRASMWGFYSSCLQLGG